jgi:acyl-CoA reductase-like NAD-dependent aldehyde dehydrogenase
MDYRGIWVNGRLMPTRGSDVGEVYDPSNGSIVGSTAQANEDDVLDAIAAAERAFGGWRSTPPVDRAPHLHAIATQIRAHADELAKLLVAEQGKPHRDNLAELKLAASVFDFYAELARNSAGNVIPAESPSQFDFTLREPYGVTACLIPWNFPIQLMSWKVAPALAAGNTVIIKPSGKTPLATLRFAETALAHLPPGVANVVTGRGTEVGRVFATHPSVRHVALTGSVETGRRLTQLASPLMKKLTLELGGKDPLVIGPDVEPEFAARAVAFAALLNAGQCCTSTERVYVAKELHDDFVEALLDVVGKMRVGPGSDDATDMGPVIDLAARERIERQVDEAIVAGARRIAGGRPADLDQGAYMLLDVRQEMSVMREETFGPVIPVARYDDFDDAITLANDSDYGLAASLLSHDPRLVMRFATGVVAGTIYINDPLTPSAAAPFGGMKSSGMGRELGDEGLAEFTQTKHVHWDVEGLPQPGWRPLHP